MKQKYQKDLFSAAIFLVAFVMWTILVRVMDVQSIGPMRSAVGFACINSYVHNLTDVHMGLYTLTDLLSLIPLGIVSGFGALGIRQWIGRGSIRQVDADILLLGAFYVLMLAAYGFFEAVVINYRPVLIEGLLEVSYPSSTTVLALCVMLTAAMQADIRIKNRIVRKLAAGAAVVFAVAMVIGRLLSGVHWFTDVAGGIFLSMGLALLYRGLCGKIG